ncbi:hypothetical protein PsorP6_009362 [Peronosclerospora sorghi]|uniref:Uncharacterized protein n=1 Tax=Peronosclerospora sorghi TaxID=230839 RepID=A0ACC0W1X4_9STRA|nr:hypothetical protein PsorP6_009362 [Peronosclerospora sorghi]
MTALRTLLLAVEREDARLDDVLASFAQDLGLTNASSTSAPSTDLTHALLSLDPHCDVLVRMWPDPVHLRPRWANRQSVATFLHVVTHFLHAQDEPHAQAFGLRLLREKQTQLEKCLSWSDKPWIEYRTLELLTAMVKVSPVTAREFVRRWHLEAPAFGNLASRRWKATAADDDNAPCSLREAYVDLVLAVTTCPDPSVYRFAMKERGLTASLFHSLDSDAPRLLTTICATLRTHVLANTDVDRKSKCHVFAASSIHQFIALLATDNHNDDEHDREHVRNEALHMLEALFFDQQYAVYTIPQDKAWPLLLWKSTSGALETTSDERYALQVMRTAVAAIGVKELVRSRQAQTFVKHVVTTYPAYLADYLAALALPLEPQPCYRWFSIASLLQMLLSCSLDSLVPAGIGPLTSTCAAKTLTSRLIAPGNFRKELSRSLQHGNALVVYAALGIVHVLLERYGSVTRGLRAPPPVVSDIRAELRCLVPSPEVLVSLLLKLSPRAGEPHATLVYVRALAVFCSYQVCLPGELKVDLAKLVRWHDVAHALRPNAGNRLHTLRLGEMLRCLLVVAPARLRALVASASLVQLLQLYIVHTSTTLHDLLGRVLERWFLTLDIFGLDTRGVATEEVTIWLESLAQSRDTACAAVMEQLVHALEADPLVYVAREGPRPVGTKVACVSPMTRALVHFLFSHAIETGPVAAGRTNPSVRAFGLRIVLALLPLEGEHDSGQQGIDVLDALAPIHDYLLARGIVSGHALVRTFEPWKDARLEALTHTLPLSLVFELVVFRLASTECDVDAVSRGVVHWITQRLQANQVAAADAVRLCDQVLFLFAWPRTHRIPDASLSRLCKLALTLVSFCRLVLNDQDVACRRLVHKLHTVRTRTNKAWLWRHILALDLVARRSDQRETIWTTGSELTSLVDRGSVPLVALVASQLPCHLRLMMLEKLLNKSSDTSMCASNRVLLERLLLSLQHETRTSFPAAKSLAWKLWQWLERHASACTPEICTTSFRVVHHCGGIDASTVIASISTWLAPLVVQSACSRAACCTMLRAMVHAMDCTHATSAFPRVLEQALATQLERQEDERVMCFVLCAIYDVFWRLATSELWERAYKWSVHYFEQMVLGLQVDGHGAEWALLNNVMLDDAFKFHADAWQASVEQTVQKLARVEGTAILSSKQVCVLMVGLRPIKWLDRADELLVVLIRSVLTAVEAATTESLSREVEATLVVVDKVVAMVQTQGDEKRLATCTLLRPLYTRTCAHLRQPSCGFEALVRLIAAFLRLIGHDAQRVDYDVHLLDELVVQHAKLVPSLTNRANERLGLVLVAILAHVLRVTQTYSRTLLQTLLRAYTMSLSRVDRNLRVVFAAFEAQNHVTVQSLGYRFGDAVQMSRVDCVDDATWILDGGLDPARLRATIDAFPLDREVATTKDAAMLTLDDACPSSNCSEMVYDPAFLLPLLAYLVSSSEWSDRSFVQHGYLGLALRATSSNDQGMREYAYGILAHVYDAMQASTWHAGRQVVLLLDVFRQGLAQPLAQVPSLLTIFLNDALHVVTRPTHPLYAQVNHFLLARPALDCHDVPMFYALFHTRTPSTFPQERSWLLQVLRRGSCSQVDVDLLARRHVVPLLLSFFTSDVADGQTQLMIVQILHATVRTASPSVRSFMTILEWLATQFVAKWVRTNVSSTSTTLLSSLMLVLEEGLADRVWEALEPREQTTVAHQVMHVFATLYAALFVRTPHHEDDRIRTKAADIAVLVVRRATEESAVDVLDKALALVVQEESDTESRLACAEVLATQLTPWLLDRGHFQAKRAFFHDWARVYTHVLELLVTCKLNGTLTQQQRAQEALMRVTKGLEDLPSVKKLVRTGTTQPDSISPLLL